AWVSSVLASAIPGSANYDPVNDALLNQGPSLLTLDLTQGEGIDPEALLAGADRARQQLLLAATIKNLNYNPSTGALAFQVQNNSGHKLISGFPEGRRMFINVKAYAGESLIYEVNPYDAAAGTLKGLDYPYQPDPNGVLPAPQALAPSEGRVDELVYEMHPESTLTGETQSFHFALGTGRDKDNRIPPKGFDIANAASRLSEPVWHGVIDPNYFTALEYEGGYDDVDLADYGISIPGADYVEVNLFYQTTSREYIEFLRDEINGTGNLTLPTTPGVPGPGDPANYIVQTEPFFAQLRAWGDTIWQLWTHNVDVDGARPFLMAQATAGTPPPGCTLTAPTLLVATPGNGEVTLEWSLVDGAIGYNVYYDQAGKAQLVGDAGDTTMFVDTGLSNGIEYCYKVTAYDATCESDYSNILCAIPTNQGQATDPAGVVMLETGIYVGRGNNKTFVPQSTFNAGDGVVIRAYVMDGVTGLPLADATVELLVTGPESLSLTTDPSDADGMAETNWQTKRPGKKNPGTTPGVYTVQTKNVTAATYHWDGVTTNTTFTIQ
ncbi:MAG: fibronectin type III domain-containing protein, partial [Planctomycetota bacterium]